MVKAGRVMVRAGRVILNTAECMARCCGPGQLYYRLKLCGTVVPPGVPEYIAVAVPFACGGCPLNTGRIVIYRSHCYFALGPDNCDHLLICAENKCEAAQYRRDQLDPTDLIVSAGDLTCKPLRQTCQDVPCVPVVPGCCSNVGLSPYCGDGSTQIPCKYPKKFSVARYGSYRVQSWTFDDPQHCAGYRQCEDTKLDFNITAEFQCEEGQGARSQATMRNLVGAAVASGYNPPYDYLNGTRTFHYDGSMRNIDYFSYFDGVNFIGDLINGLPHPFGVVFNCNGDHSTDYNDTTVGGCIRHTESCEGGRHIVTDAGVCRNGQLNHVVYEDCYLRILNHTGIGNFDVPCQGTPAWRESAFDQTSVSELLACPEDNAVSYINPGSPVENGSIFPLAGGRLRYAAIRQQTSTGGLF